MTWNFSSVNQSKHAVVFFFNRFPKIKIGVYTRNYYLMYTGTPRLGSLDNRHRNGAAIYPLARGRGNVLKAGNKASKFW